MSLLISENADLTGLNTLKSKARAAFLCEIHSEEDIIQFSDDTRFQSMKRLILGGGSNLLFSKDFDGIVLANDVRGISIESISDVDVLVNIGAGENWHELVLWTLSQDFFGLENLSLIPGTVGAAPIQNIGAYGVELKDVFRSCKVWDFDQARFVTFSKEDCQFGYRDSLFKHSEPGRYFITSVTLRLSKIARSNTQYGDVRRVLEENGFTEPFHPKNVSEAVIQIRQSKLPDPAVTPNAGSFFKNPVITKSQYTEVLKSWPDTPHYPVDDDHVKVPAGWLIENTGLKGFRQGNVGTFPKQALVIVNYGKALGEEIVKFAYFIIDSVEKKFGIRLSPEVNII